MTSPVRPEWCVYYIDPEQPNDGRGTVWRQGVGTYWTPDEMTAKEAMRKLLPRDLEGPVWAFAHAKLSSAGAWYDLHYPEGVEPRLKREPDRPLGPHIWVPA